MLRIAICDDSQCDREIVHEFVTEYCEERNIKAQINVYNHPDTLLSECEVFRPHLYILDIVMPMVTGIEAARELRWSQKEAQIIFTTSESSFALEAYDVNPSNYLLKPVDKNKLSNAMDIALRHVKLSEEKSFSIKVKGGYKSIQLKKLMYLEYRNHVVFYHMEDGEVINTLTLRIGFPEYLRQNHENMCLLQCHESFAVNMTAIDKLTKTDVELTNKEVIPVSKSRYQEVLESYLGK